MFEIDLKRGYSRSGGPGTAGDAMEKVRPFLPIFAGLAALSLVLWGIGSSQESKLIGQRTELAALQQTVTAHRQELTALAGQRGAMAATSNKEIYWSDVIRVFSEKLPDKIWLADVKVTTSTPPKDKPDAPVVRTLQIDGGVLSAASEGNLDLVAGFLETLQADPRYREAFGPARLESVTRGGTADPYTLSFRITVPFLPA